MQGVGARRQPRQVGGLRGARTRARGCQPRLTLSPLMCHQPRMGPDPKARRRTHQHALLILEELLRVLTELHDLVGLRGDTGDGGW